MVGAGEMGAVSGYLCIQHVREVGENRKGWADRKKACGLCAHGGGKMGLLLRTGGGWGDRENGALADTGSW